MVWTICVCIGLKSRAHAPQLEGVLLPANVPKDTWPLDTPPDYEQSWHRTAGNLALDIEIDCNSHTYCIDWSRGHGSTVCAPTPATRAPSPRPFPVRIWAALFSFQDFHSGWFCAINCNSSPHRVSDSSSRVASAEIGSRKSACSNERHDRYSYKCYVLR